MPCKKYFCNLQINDINDTVQHANFEGYTMKSVVFIPYSLGPDVLTAGDLNHATQPHPHQHQQQGDVFAKIGGSLKGPYMNDVS